jgi:CelD/BcsL family acetyltransferase involved in cellulose biosynthesis
MCGEMAAAGRLQLLEMRGGGRTAAMQVNLLDGGTLFGMKVAFNRDLATFSPGALLEADALQIFHDRHDLTAADSCAEPGNELLNALWPDRRRLETVLIPTGRLRAKLVDIALPAEAAARRVVRAQRRARKALRGRRG